MRETGTGQQVAHLHDRLMMMMMMMMMMMILKHFWCQRSLRLCVLPQMSNSFNIRYSGTYKVTAF